jgi:hypothetical protein
MRTGGLNLSGFINRDERRANRRSATNFSDKDVDWMSERVRFYIRRGSLAVYAIEHAVVDFRKLHA